MQQNELDNKVVLLWPPDAEEEEWEVIIYQDHGKKKTVFTTTDYEAARDCALAIARMLGVVAGHPTRDGEIVDL